MHVHTASQDKGITLVNVFDIILLKIELDELKVIPQIIFSEPIPVVLE
ncbi:MAG TPA: hypothetical protein VFP87_06770 [Chitinophagaceae bacterium]|nr:hypothetical protein [Chitinophagaceae bacterium]